MTCQIRESDRARFAGSLAVAGAALIAACSGGGVEDAHQEARGAAIVALTRVPAALGCIRITAAGASRSETRDFALSPGASTAALRLTRLPVGEVSFEASAFESTCEAVDGDSVPAWLSSAPVDATLASDEVASVSIRMVRNGRSSVAVDFADEELGTPQCAETNLALNTTGAGYPDPVTYSDVGWGGGSYPWQIVDGLTAYAAWASGLAFTGGIPGYAGACGTRHAAIDFGAPRTFHKIRAWHHGPFEEHVPNTAWIEYWDGANWVAAQDTWSLRPELESSGTATSVPTEHTFEPVTASRVRFVMENCDLQGHGWLYELEVLGCQ